MKFTIKKGKHYSDCFLFKVLNFFNFTGQLKFKIKFDNSCSYNLNNVNQYDINKLFGFSNGFHHKNSARFGWNYLDGKIVIHAYCYINGKRQFNEISRLDLMTEYDFKIEEISESYLFKIELDGQVISEKSVNKTSNLRFSYNLWPYFGGDETAPHDMFIYLKKLS